MGGAQGKIQISSIRSRVNGKQSCFVDGIEQTAITLEHRGKANEMILLFVDEARCFSD